MDNEVTIGTPPEAPDTGVSIGAPEANPALPDDVATNRAVKIQSSVGKAIQQKSVDEIRQEIQAGRESSMRDMAASSYEAERNQRKLDLLRTMAAQSDRPLNETDIARMNDPFNPINIPNSPVSVVEKNYGQQYIQSVQEAVDSTRSHIQEAPPEQLVDAYNKGGELTARMEGYKKLREDAEAELAKQTYMGYGADMLKNMFQPYVEFKMRGLATGTLSGGLLLGTNIQSSADRVFGLPLTDSLQKAKEIGDYLGKDNPQLAVKWYEYLEGLPTTDRILDNAFTALMPLDYASLGKLGIKAAKNVDLSIRANQAVRQMVEVADKVGASAAGRAEAAGDLGKASEIRSNGVILNQLDGKANPVDAVTEPLLTVLNQSKDKIAENQGNLATEGVRRIQEQYAASGQGFIQNLINSARINRIPMALATQNAVKILKDAVLDYYPGIRNAILDVSDPLYEPRSNTYWHEVTIGNFDGTLFSHPKVAEAYARLHNMEDVKIIQGQGSVTNERIQKLLDLKVKHEKDLADTEAGLNNNKAKLKNDKLTEADHAKAKEQVDLFNEYKKGLQPKLDEVNLRLKSDETYVRVSHLSKENESLALATKGIKANLKDRVKFPDGFEPRNQLVASLKENEARLRSNNAEIKAIATGNASVIGSNTAVTQHGVGYKIVLRRPLVETDRTVRDLLTREAPKPGERLGKIIPDAVSTSSSTGFKSLLNAALWRFRGADDTLAISENIQRKIGTYTQSLFKKWASDEAQHIRQISTGLIRNDPVTGDPIPYWKAKGTQIWNKLSRDKPYTTDKGERLGMHDAFIRTLEHARDARDDAGRVGYFFQTPGELNDHYLRYFNQSPSFAEHQAYFAFTRMVEGDRMLREISEFRNRARLGVEQFQLSTRVKNTLSDSPWFDGRVLKIFPGGDDVLMIMGRRQGEEKIVNLGGAGLSPRELEEYRAGVKTGKYKVIEVYAPEHTPLREWSDVAGNDHVRYVLTENAKSKPIEFNHVNKRGGGHFEYDYDHFLKQAKMYHQIDSINGVKGRYKSVYVGDTTFMPLLNRAMGHDIADKMHEVQRLLRLGDVEGAKEFSQNNLPIEWDKLHGMFRPGRDEIGREVPPLLDLNEKFVVVPKGRTVLDSDPALASKYDKDFKNSAESGSLNRQFNVAYNTERDSEGLRHLMDVGTPGNPVYKYSPTTKFIDPITTMNKALNRIVNTTFMDDYKIYAVEHWLREAEEHLAPMGQKLARTSPFWVFTNATDKSAFNASTPWETMRNLLSNRYKIMQFTGIPSQFDTAMHSTKQMLADWAYAKFGPEEGRTLAQKAVSIAPNWMLSHIHDPVTWMRSMTFHEKLGLFNPAQMLVQAQTYATILAVSPFHGVSGTYAAMLHAWSRINRNPEILKSLDAYASKLSVFGQSKWKPGEFLEAMEAYDHTGFGNVAGEHANLDTALKTDFVGNGAKSLLHGGTWFFRQGERSVRDGAWYTAFREFREANPTKTLTKDDLGKILNRADLLTANMSRASNSMLQSGILSLPTQFLTYQIRLAELFLSNRIDAMAKARILAVYGALYGAPSAVGVMGLPLADSFRKEAVQRGYTVGESWYKTAIMEGLPAITLAMITGKGDIEAGNKYNIGARYGSPGFTFFNEALKSNHPMWQILAGASGTTLLDNITTTLGPFWRVMGAQLNSDNSKKAYPLKLDDLTDAIKSYSTTGAQAVKLIMAIETGKWMSKNEGYVGDVTKANAAIMAITGLSPQAQDDNYLKGNLHAAQEEFQKQVMKDAIKELRRGYQAQKDKDYNNAQSYFKRAESIMTVAGFPVERKASVYAASLRGQEGMIKDGDWQFASDNVPSSRNDILGIPTPFTTQSNIPQTRLKQFRTESDIHKKEK